MKLLARVHQEPSFGLKIKTQLGSQENLQSFYQILPFWSFLIRVIFNFLYFRFSYYLGGGLSPPWFHIPNIILHGIVSVLLLLVFSILFGGYEVDPESEEVRFKAAKSALLCALLFAVHPIHTESVSLIIQFQPMQELSLPSWIKLIILFNPIAECTQSGQNSIEVWPF